MIELFITGVVLLVCLLIGLGYRFLCREEAKDAKSIPNPPLRHPNCRCVFQPFKVGLEFQASLDETAKVFDEVGVIAEALRQSFLQPSIGAGIFLEESSPFEYDDIFSCEASIEEFTPFEAGRIAYGLGRGEEDNPYRNDEELGTEWEAGYYESFRLDGRGQESDRGDI